MVSYSFEGEEFQLRIDVDYGISGNTSVKSCSDNNFYLSSIHRLFLWEMKKTCLGAMHFSQSDFQEL